MQQLLRTNLIAHRKRNKLTAMVYTLTLACVMYLVITLQLVMVELEEDSTLERYPYHSDIKLLNWNIEGCLHPDKMDPILYKYRDSIDDFLYSTWSLGTTDPWHNMANS